MASRLRILQNIPKIRDSAVSTSVACLMATPVTAKTQDSVVLSPVCNQSALLPHNLKLYINPTKQTITAQTHYKAPTTLTRPNKITMTATTASTTTTNAMINELQTISDNSKKVTFRSHVEYVIIPRVNPKTKHLLYYSKCELFLIKVELKRQFLVYRSMMAAAAAKKRIAVVAENSSDDERPTKRLRTIPCAVSVP